MCIRDSYRAARPIERAGAELRAHRGTQFDPEIVDAFERVVDEEGRIRTLDDSIEQHLTTEVHVPFIASNEWHAGLAVVPVLQPVLQQLPVAGSSRVEPCAVTPDGEERAVAVSGEGCEIVVPVLSLIH